MQGGMGSMPGEMRAMVQGVITAADNTSITVQMKDGIFRTVYVNSSTTIMVFNGTSTAPTTGTMADLTTGKNVMVEGKPAQNGGLNAIHVKVGTFPLPMQGAMMFEAKTPPGAPGGQGQGMMMYGWQTPPTQ